MKWLKNNRNFAVKTITHSRNYSNYPNYGIYKQPYQSCQLFELSSR